MDTPENNASDSSQKAGRAALACSALPSYFSSQGIPACSRWGKLEIEYLAWIYVTGMARDGDKWHEVTAVRCKELLTEEERRFVSPYLGMAIDGRCVDWWAMVSQQLTSAEGAFKVGGLAWNRWKFDRQNTQAERQPAEKH